MPTAGVINSQGSRADIEIQLSPASLTITTDLSIDLIYPCFSKLDLLQDLVRADIQLLALEGYWLEEWQTESNYKIGPYLSQFRNLKVIFTITNMKLNEKHTGDERLVAPETEEELLESEESMPFIIEFFNACQQ